MSLTLGETSPLLISGLWLRCGCVLGVSLLEQYIFSNPRKLPWSPASPNTQGMLWNPLVEWNQGQPPQNGLSRTLRPPTFAMISIYKQFKMSCGKARPSWYMPLSCFWLVILLLPAFRQGLMSPRMVSIAEDGCELVLLPPPPWCGDCRLRYHSIWFAQCWRLIELRGLCGAVWACGHLQAVTSPLSRGLCSFLLVRTLFHGIKSPLWDFLKAQSPNVVILSGPGVLALT